MLEEIRKKIDEINKQLEKLEGVERLASEGNAKMGDVNDEAGKLLNLNTQLQDLFVKYVLELAERMDTNRIRLMKEIGY